MRAPNPIESEKVRSYKLQYRESASTRRALLASVRECDAANICKPATSFDYSPSNPEWERIPTTISVTNIREGGSGFSAYQDTAAARIFVGDLDGDGRDDVMYRRYNSTLRRYQPYYHSSNGRGFSTLNVIEVEELQPTAQNITDVDSLIDIDADGKMELALLRNTHTPDHCVLQPTAETFRFRCPINASLALEGGSAPSFSLYADSNGDGFPEKVRTHDDSFFYAHINTRGALGPYVPFMTDNFTGEFFREATDPSSGVRPVDFNGDARPEIVMLARSDSKMSYRQLDADGNLRQGPTNLPEDTFGRPYTYIDVNGDGQQCLVRLFVGQHHQLHQVGPADEHGSRLSAAPELLHSRRHTCPA